MPFSTHCISNLLFQLFCTYKEGDSTHAKHFLKGRRGVCCLGFDQRSRTRRCDREWEIYNRDMTLLNHGFKHFTCGCCFCFWSLAWSSQARHLGWKDGCKAGESQDKPEYVCGLESMLTFPCLHASHFMTMLTCRKTWHPLLGYKYTPGLGIREDWIRLGWSLESCN